MGTIGLRHFVFGEGVPIQLNTVPGTVRGNGVSLFDHDRVLDEPFESEHMDFEE